MINDRRQLDRKSAIQRVFDEWGIDAEFFEATDGKLLTAKDVQQLQLKKCPDYKHETGRHISMEEVRMESLTNLDDWLVKKVQPTKTRP